MLYADFVNVRALAAADGEGAIHKRIIMRGLFGCKGWAAVFDRDILGEMLVGVEADAIDGDEMVEEGDDVGKRLNWAGKHVRFLSRKAV